MIVFNDLHGNLSALESLLANTSGPWLCNGDALGTGGDNYECLALLRRRGVRCTLGNHEVDLVHLYRLPSRELAWLREWPLQLEWEGGFFTHTLIEDTSVGPHFQRVHHDHQAQELVARSNGRPVFIGHTHLPGYWTVGQQTRWHPVFGPRELVLEEGVRYVLNPGSLGEPQRADHPRYLQWSGNQVSWRAL